MNERRKLSYETSTDVRIGGAPAGPHKVIVDLDWPPNNLGPYATLLKETDFKLEIIAILNKKATTPQ